MLRSPKSVFSSSYNTFYFITSDKYTPDNFSPLLL